MARVCSQRDGKPWRSGPDHTALLSSIQERTAHVLKFGKDIQVTTTSAPLVQLEAIHVDEVNPRHELRRRLERANVTSH